jgi:hypothetical protein
VKGLVTCYRVIPHPTYIIVAAFNEIPSPMLTVVTLDEQHTYKCSHPAADRISWRVNDNILGTDIFTFPGIEYTDTYSHPYEAVYTLKITALSQNNESTIQCAALFTVDRSPQISPVVTFLIQGRSFALHAVL